MTLAVNPKDIAVLRDGKAPLDLLEHAADIEIARALKTGAIKYGKKNFHEAPVLASVYGAAVRRHIGAWLDGQDLDPDSGLSHWAHIGACVHVMFAAMSRDKYIDDRGPQPPETSLEA